MMTTVPTTTYILPELRNVSAISGLLVACANTAMQFKVNRIKTSNLFINL